ncbi:hypothetical protein [Actinophytocola sp.]|uniref:hypothetical protein n=1 Tax=Actinophytocola sp. TaxID=1872138 RepID=UPI00389B3022
MTEDLGFPGNREIVERQLAVATTQALYLAGETARAGHRTLAERAAELVRGMEMVPALERFWTAPPAPAAVAAASRDGIPADIAEAYVRAEAEVKNILAQVFPD